MKQLLKNKLSSILNIFKTFFHDDITAFGQIIIGFKFNILIEVRSGFEPL